MQVEFFGIPRQRAGVATATTSGKTLGDVLRDLARQFPQFAMDCLDKELQLEEHVIVNINGLRFVRDSRIALEPEDVLMILSADGGG